MATLLVLFYTTKGERSGSVVECLTLNRKAVVSSLTSVSDCVVVLEQLRHIYPSLVLVQPRKTHPCLTERLLMGRKESNQTNKQTIPQGNQGTKIFKYCTCPAGRVTYNFHSFRKQLHLSFKSICNKEHKGVICNMTTSSNSFQSTRPTGRITYPF